jgi:phospholipid transport system substrate-binding protein
MKAKIMLLLVLAVFLTVPGGGLSAEGKATDVVRKMLDSVISIQTDPALQGQAARPTRKDEIKKVILSNFNFDDMAQQTLGAYWKGMTAARRAEFKSIFQDLFLDSYSRLVLDFVGKEKIAYLGEEDGQGQTTVKTRIHRVSEAIPVDYYVNGAKDRLLVRDVSIDGVSIVQNYRKSFSRVIQQESYDGLLKRMKLQQQAVEKG